MAARLSNLLLTVMTLGAACQSAPAALEAPEDSLAASAYKAIDLGTDGGATIVTPTAIRDNGVIVGILGGYDLTAGTRGFVYGNGTMRQLPGAQGDEAHVMSSAGSIAGQRESDATLLIWDSPETPPRRLQTGFPLQPQTRVLGFNDRGDVLTNVDDDGKHGRALIWRNNVPQDLGGFEVSPTGRSTYARAWNSRGQVVGRSKVRDVSPPGDVVHPFLWDDGVMRDLGVLGSVICGDPPIDCSGGEAVDINATGVVVGGVTGEDGGTRAFVWENGVMRDLGVYPGEYTRAAAINDRGQILGVHATGYFLWDQSRVQMIEGNRLYAYALGEQGQVIGEMPDAEGNVHAFVWQDGRLTDLGPGSAKAINSQGEIIGTNGYRGILWRRGSGTPAAP